MTQTWSNSKKTKTCGLLSWHLKHLSAKKTYDWKEKAFPMIHLNFSEHPILASLEGDIAQELSLPMNGAFSEKLVYISTACDAHHPYFLGYRFWDYRVERGKFFSWDAIYPLVLHPPNTTPLHRPVWKSLTCFSFFLAHINSFSPPSYLLFVFQCKEDEARRIRRVPLLLYFLYREMLFTRKISS